MVTDPPYNVGKDYGTHDDSMPPEEYFAWCDKWISLCESSDIVLVAPKKHLPWFWSRLPKQHLVVVTWDCAGAMFGSYLSKYAPILAPHGNDRPRLPDVWTGIPMPAWGALFREDGYGHPGKTPDELTRRLVGAYSSQDATVLDPFMGTGTTGVACMSLGRKFIGIEIDPKYFGQACERIEDAQRQERLFA